MSPVNVGAIGAYIREQREQAKISLRQLAQSAGISNPYLSQIERGLRRPSADILQQIAKGLRISAEALYVQAGFLEDRPPGSAVRDAVLTDEELTERQKQMLIEIYDSLRRETAIARAEAAESVEPDAVLPPDEGALAWPEDPTRGALTGRRRRLAIARSYLGSGDQQADDDEADDDEAAWGDATGDSPWGEYRKTGAPEAGSGGPAAGPADDDGGPGGTVHQFPPSSPSR